MPKEDDDLTEFDELYAAMGGVYSIDEFGEEVWDFGWTPEEDIAPFDKLIGYPPPFSQVHPDLIGKGAGQVRLLYEEARTVWARDLDIGPQGTIDCVSWGVGGAIDLLACVEIACGQAETYTWEDRVCTEALHALARVEYGGGGFTNSLRGTIAARDGGTISRRQLGAYSPQRADDWGQSGLPDHLEPIARNHTVVDACEISSFEEARDAIFAGHPIAIGSSQGFKNGGRRDANGFATAARTKWKHCMKFVAMRDDNLPGLLCMNSWRENDGPSGKFDIPKGTFWVHRETCNRMFNIGSGFALAAFNGYPAS